MARSTRLVFLEAFVSLCIATSAIAQVAPAVDPDMLRHPVAMAGEANQESFALTFRTFLGPTTDLAATPPGTLVINEIELGTGDWIEIYNPGTESIDLSGWRLDLWDPSGWSNTYVFPSLYLWADSYVVVHEEGDTADDTVTDLHTGWSIPWSNEVGGAAGLETAGQMPVDYVRWGQDLPIPDPAPWGWRDRLGAVIPAAGKTLARAPNGADDDVFGDWCGHPGSPGAANLPSDQSFPDSPCTCGALYLGQPLNTIVVYGPWTVDDTPIVLEACNTFNLSWEEPTSFEPFSLEPGAEMVLRTGRAVVFRSGSRVGEGAHLVIEIDPQLRQ